MLSSSPALVRNPDGAVVGDYRLRHRDASFALDLGPVKFEGGVSVGEPVPPAMIKRLLAVYGSDLTPEPWGSPPPVAVAAAPQAPAVEEPVVEVAMDLDTFRALAEAHGIPVTHDWSLKRIRAALKAKGV